MKTSEEIINKLKEIYGDEYDYSNVEYKGALEKIELICKKHGSFFNRFYNLYNGCGCNKCTKEHKIDEKWEYYINKSKEIHGNKYEYIKDGFENSTSKIKIICPIHGEFLQTFNNHINQKQGCEKCYHDSKIGKYKMTTEEFVKKAKQVHGDKYDYSETIYNGLKNKLKIICPKHGCFEQVSYDHLRGFGCEKCKFEKNTDSTENFVKKAKKIHGDKYDYSKVKYVNNHTKVCIICPKHGEFMQFPLDHLLGSGCQKCNMSHLEREIMQLLNDNSIDYIYQAKKENLKWLKRQSVDFYLPDYNIAIECQGKQHFKPVEIFGGEKKLNEQIERDKKKKNLCEKNNLDLIYFSKEKMDNEKYFSNKDDLIFYIKRKKENH